MDRRRFLKMGISASGAMAASVFLPLGTLAKGGNQDMEMQELLATVGYECIPLCREHDSCLVIDPGIFTRSIATLRKDMGPDVKICVVMKSDAYGHGIENLIAEAVKAKPDYIGLVENREIRQSIEWMDKAGMRAAILRIAPATFYEAAEAVVKRWPVEEVVGYLPQAEMLLRIALWVGKKRGRSFSIPVHINIDTGMGRMGFKHVEDIKKAMALPGLKVCGIMTHFANAYDLKRGEDLTGERFHSKYPKDKMLEAIFRSDLATGGKSIPFIKALKEAGEPTLVIEPGRSLVEDSGVTISRVGHVKKVDGVHDLVALEAGVVNFGDALEHEAPMNKWSLATGLKKKEVGPFNAFLAGHLCFTGDMPSRYKVTLARKPERGDVLLTHDTGAYDPQFYAANTNAFARPARVLVHEDGSVEFIKTRDTIEDIYSLKG